MPKNPVCPNCAIAMKPASYGMRLPGPEDKDDYYDMGCLVDFPLVTFGCTRCHYELLEDGSANPRTS